MVQMTPKRTLIVQPRLDRQIRALENLRVALGTARWGLPMKFLTAIILVLAFVTTVVSDGAMAAPFTVGQAVVAPPSTTSPPATNSTCNNYNDYVSNSGAQLNGNHPGYCQFSSAQITLNGVPFDKFWQDVSNPTVVLPLSEKPYDVSYDGRCATAKKLKIDVSMQVQTSRSDWSGAAQVGQACVKEWNRRSPATLVNMPTNAAALSALQRMVNYLNFSLRKDPTILQSCGLTRQPVADLAKKIKNFMRPWVMWAQYSVPAEASGDECKLHCGVCSSGWAGTITAKRTYAGTTTSPPSGNSYKETDTYFVGGASSNPKNIPADWTSDSPLTGSGTLGSSTFTWTLHAALAGQCDPMGNAVCLQTLPQGNLVTFTDASSPGVYDPTGYTWSQDGGATKPGAAYETPTQNIMPNIIETTPGVAVGQNSNSQCKTGPPSWPWQTIGCTIFWEWELYKQP
jgi:hypothetical protein